jgi:hypothetical protein
MEADRPLERNHSLAVRSAGADRGDAFRRAAGVGRRGDSGLEALTPAEVNGWAGKALNITLSRPLDEDDRSSAWAPRQRAFTSETFLLSFSLPNFHFHAVTAYDILRSRGVPLGKRDYEGQLRTRSTLAQIGLCDTRLD